MKMNRSLKMWMVGAAVVGTGALLAGRAAAVSENANVSGTVNSKFTIALDTSTLSFGFVDPQTTTNLLIANTATCRTNRGNVWYLKVKHGGDVSDVALQTRSSGGVGINQSVFTDMTTADQTTYTSGLGEDRNLPLGTILAFDYAMVVGNASPGQKDWIVTYTFTETL